MTRSPSIILLLLLLTACSFAAPQQQQPLALTHVTVIDGSGSRPMRDQTVIIRGDRIREIGKTGEVKVPAGAQVVHGGGRFLIPGLWEMHAHATAVPSFPELYLVNGVTGVRDLGGTAPGGIKGLREAIAEGRRLGPRIVAALRIVDGQQPIWPGSLAVETEAEGREAVAALKREGADLIKVYSLLPRAAYFAVLAEARRQRLPVAGHVPEAISAKEASDAGQASIEHLEGVLTACSTREAGLRQEMQAAMAKPDPRAAVLQLYRTQTRMLVETYDARKAAALFARFRKNRTWHCPTLTALRNIASVRDRGFADDPRRRYLPPFFRAVWDPDHDFRFRDLAAEEFEDLRRYFQKSVAVVGDMRRAGVQFLAGSDVATPNGFPGFSLHDELALLVAAGLTPMEALQAATRNPARSLGLEKQLGTVQVGKAADLVLLNADPLADIRNTTKIQAVIVNGRWLDREALDAMLARVEAEART
jgi:imidazolonepropionase-like amidohydrolase